MLVFLKDIFYSFPVQLLLLSFKRHQFLLFFWVLIFVIAISRFGQSLGAPADFLDPEYLGSVGYLSFAVVGLGFGVMYVTWNIVMYILNSHRFPFMASLQYPLGMFFINNSIIPLTFAIAYFISFIIFQTQNEYQGWLPLFFDALGFTAGFTTIIMLTALYFNLTNKNAGSIIEENKHTLRRKRAWRRIQFNEELETLHLNRVDYYLTNHLSIRHTRTVEHYDSRLHQLVFKRHHWNAFIASLAALTFLVACGFFLEKPVFQIPIAACIFIFISLLMSMFGLFMYWTGGWGTSAIIVFFLLANQLTKYDVLGYQSRVYGLNYNNSKAAYNLEKFREISSDDNIEKDKKYFLEILENWKRKNTDPKNPGKKPKLYFLNVSGGGLRSALFCMSVIQDCDSLAGGTLMDKTFLISGASGGMFAATYLRELFLEKKRGMPVNLQNKIYREKITQDILNPIAISMLTNDVLVPFHRFQLKDQKYNVDRGYIFEKTYSRNTGFPFEKTIGDYREPERSGKVPLLIYHSTVMNDSRRYFISPHPVSFLMRPHGKKALDNKLEIDGIDFCRFFEKQGGENLLVTSALRMDATFPFIFPNPVLPSTPPTYVMDGGALDNFGVETTLRFLNTFKDWVSKNTSGVVIIQMRDSEKFEEPEEATQKTVLDRLTDPLGTVYVNMERMQDYLTDHRLNDMDEDLRGKLQFVLFEYTSEKEENKAAMSMHLTTREKLNILESLNRKNNVEAFNSLKRLVQE